MKDNLIITTNSQLFKLSLLFLLTFLLMINSSLCGYTEKTTLNHKENDIIIKFEDEKFIHLSLPADEYIMRLRSLGDFDLLIQPKDKNTSIENLFVHECDTAIITINNNPMLKFSPICISGHISINEKDIKPNDIKNETNDPPKTIDKDKNNEEDKNNDNKLQLENELRSSTAIYYTDDQEEKDVNNNNKDDKPNKVKKIISYYIDTITEQEIEIRFFNEVIRNNFLELKTNIDVEGLTICGYYIISNTCPFIEVHWIGKRRSFLQFLESSDMLKNRLPGL
jgi:hypothetical protein